MERREVLAREIFEAFVVKKASPSSSCSYGNVLFLSRLEHVKGHWCRPVEKRHREKMELTRDFGVMIL